MAENHVQPIVTAKASARMEFVSAILNTVVWTVREVNRTSNIVICTYIAALDLVWFIGTHYI